MVGALVTGCASAQQDLGDSSPPVKEFVTGGARLRNRKVRMDVQIGRAVSQPPIKSSTTTAKPNAVVTP